MSLIAWTAVRGIVGFYIVASALFMSALIDVCILGLIGYKTVLDSKISADESSRSPITVVVLLLMGF